MADTVNGGSGGAHVAWLAGEVTGWEREGLIGPDAARLILARYGLVAGGESPRSLRQTRIAQLVGTVGAVLVGAGVLVIVGANWEAIPRLARVALLLIAMLGFYASGYRLAHGGGSYPGAGRALIFAGSLVWVSSIFLVAQMFHLSEGGDPEYARGLLYAFLGLLLLAYALRSPLQLAAALAAGSAWAVLAFTWDINAAWLLLKLLVIGALLYLAGLWHREHPSVAEMAPGYGKFGIALAAIGLYGLTFNVALGWSEVQGLSRVTLASYSAATAAGFLGAAWLAVRTWRREDRTGAAEAAGAAVLLLFAVGFAAGFRGPAGAARFDTALMPVAANVLLLALEMGCIWVGWNRARPGLINAGLTLFFIHLMTRYFDLFAAMLPSGMAFIGAGVLLLLAAFGLERQRRHLLHTMPHGAAFPEGGMA